MAAVFSAVVLRLACMQIVNYDYFEERAVNRCRYVEVYEPRRAPIVTADGVVVAEDRGVLDVAAYIPELDVETNVVELLAANLKPAAAEIRRALDEIRAGYWGIAAEKRPAGMRLPFEISRSAAGRIGAALKKYPEKYNGSLRIAAEKDSETGGECCAVFTDVRKLEQETTVLARLSELLGADAAALSERVSLRKKQVAEITNKFQRRYEENLPVTLIKNVTLDEAGAVELDPENFPGIVITTRKERFYPLDDAFAHVTGFLRPLTASECGVYGEQGRMIRKGIKVFENVDKMSCARCFYEDDRVGAVGVEACYDSILAGQKGLVVKERNARSAVTTEEEMLSCVGGDAITLTIDSRIQMAAQKAFWDEEKQEPVTGCAVVLDANTGAVLALVSIPSYDPNTFRKAENYSEILKPPYGLLNRAVSGAFPPGSTIKLLSAVAALEEGAVTPETTFCCRGYLHEPKSFKCEAAHGDIAIQNAIIESCNVYFYNIGERIASQERPKIQEWARKFGFGRKTGIDLAGESEGLVPTPELKASRLAEARKKYEEAKTELEALRLELAEAQPAGAASAEDAGRRKKSLAEKISKLEALVDERSTRFAQLSESAAWGKGDARNLAIGQGDLLVTPIQIARFYAALANGGKLYRPHLVETPGEDYLEDTVALKPRTLAIVRKALYGVVHSAIPKGTAHGKGLEQYGAALKTGTAETGRKGTNHAYLAGYAPFDNPQIAFVVMLENTPKHGSGAAPILKKILDAAFAVKGIPKKNARN
jgi:penicillin-binding protein 2